MTDFWVVLLAGAATAYGVAGIFSGGRRLGLGLLGAALYLLVGLHTVLLVWWLGDGRIFPGWQIHPELRRFFFEEFLGGGAPAPDRAFCFVVLGAHLCALARRPDRRGLFGPLPATIFFLAVFFLYPEGEKITYHRARGPHETAYLSVVEGSGGARLILSRGAADDTFARVLLVHECETPPPEPGLLWTKDGEGIVLSFRFQRLFAVRRDGKPQAGWLPRTARECPPAREPPVSVDLRRKLSQARFEVARYLSQHGGPFVP